MHTRATNSKQERECVVTRVTHTHIYIYIYIGTSHARNEVKDKYNIENEGNHRDYTLSDG